MNKEASWIYNDKRHEYQRSVEGYMINVWQDPNGIWATSIDSVLRHSTVRRGFSTLEEAQAWAITEGVAHVLAQEEPLKEREAGV